MATAYARTHARYAQIDVAERAVRSGQRSYQEDLIRVRGFKGLPIELLDSFRLLSNARDQYLNAISITNVAQFELYVALGQPPAAALARPIPASLVPPNSPPPGAAGGAGGCFLPPPGVAKAARGLEHAPAPASP